MNQGNYQKTPTGVSLPRIARQSAATAIKKLGKALPCSVASVAGQIVTVKFEILDPTITIPNVRCPIFGPEYARSPTQIGDKGVVFSADTYLGGVSGLGGGVASLAPKSNLSTLVFFPIGNTAFTPVDPNAYTLYGPNGVVLRDSGKACTFTLTPSGIVIKVGSMTLTINASGLTVTGGEIDADGIGLKTHLTTGVVPGGGESSIPVAGTAP